MPRDMERKRKWDRENRRKERSCRPALRALAEEDGITAAEEMKRLILREQLVRDLARHG